MALDQRSEEEKRKSREAFEQNRAKLSLGGNQPAGFMGAGALAQAAPKAPVVQPAQVSPQMATNIASSQRQQNIAQQQKTQLQQRATREADVQTARQNAQKIIGLPAAQQPQAVAAMQNAVKSSVQPQPTPNIKPSNNTAAKPVMGMVPPPNNIAQPVAAQKQPVASTVEPAKSLLDDDASALNPVYNEGVTRGNSGKGFGLSVDNNPAVAKPLAPAMGGGNSGFGFRVMPPPRKAYGEDSRRQALAMDIKPYKNGMGLTTGQIALKNSILNGDDEKYANEQYTTQMNAAQGIAKAGMEQSGANSRAELGERGATSRAELNERAAGERQANQLGFDSEKFQQTLALDGRKLDQQKSNDQITNYGVKKLNEFRESWFNAKMPEEKTAIEEQMAILNTGSKDSEDYWTAIGGGETLSEDGLTASKNPDTLLNRRSGEVRQQPTAARSLSDPYVLEVNADDSKTRAERQELITAYMRG